MVQQSSSTVNKTNKINNSRKQIIKMLLVIILVFTACWCPRFLLNIIKWVAPMGEWEFNVSQVRAMASYWSIASLDTLFSLASPSTTSHGSPSYCL